MIMDKETGNLFCQSVISTLQGLVDSRNFAAALDLALIQRAAVEEADGVCAAKFLRLLAITQQQTGHLNDALKSIRCAQSKAEPQGDSIVLADIFLTLGNILRDLKHMKEAAKVYRDAESIFRRNDNPDGHARALNALAGLHFRQNDYANALTVLLEAVEVARKVGDRRKLAYIMGNIGRVYTFLGDASKAESYLNSSLELSTVENDTLEVGRIRLSIGYLLMQQGLYETASANFAQAECALVQVNSQRDLIILQTYVGELTYLSGSPAEAMVVLQKAVTAAESLVPESTLLARAMRHLAEAAMRQGLWRQSARCISRALPIMKEAGELAEVGALIRLKALVAEHEADSQQATELMSAALETLEQHASPFEYADALVAAGRSSFFGERQRCMYLFRAEEFFARQRMTAKLDEVGHLIGSLTVGSSPAAARHDNASALSGETDYLTACPAILKFKAQLAKLGRPDIPILLTGETGVGKDRMARYFHSLVRPSGPFVAINCASIPESLLESELFGYHKGAFTGAESNKAGLFFAANGGVLFLDEIGDMPLSLQTKLLGVIERRKLIPLGSTKEVSLDVVVVAATNAPLEALVQSGKFRRDLYFRLNVVAFEIPPLRNRREDIPLLLEYCLRQRGLLATNERPAPELLRQFLSYDWPGNIRELENRVKRLEVMSTLAAEGDVRELSRATFESSGAGQTNGFFEKVEEFERKLIIEALTAARGNKSEAARLLGVHEATVRTKLKRYGIAGESALLN